MIVYLRGAIRLVRHHIVSTLDGEDNTSGIRWILFEVVPDNVKVIVVGVAVEYTLGTECKMKV